MTSITDTPLLMDGVTASVRIPVCQHLKDIGLRDQIIYNSIDFHSKDDEIAAIKDAGLKQAVLLAYGPRFIWPKDKLTRFEVARLVGARSLQISLGAPVLIKSKEISPIKLAKMEFKDKIIPITIKRKLPSGEETVIEVKTAIKNWLANHAGNI